MGFVMSKTGLKSLCLNLSPGPFEWKMVTRIMLKLSVG